MMRCRRTQPTSTASGTTPRFDSRSIEWATNMLFMATWSVIATIAYLGPLIPGDGTLWHARYEKTMLAFRTHFEGAPKPTVKTFGKVVAALFIDRSRFAPGDT